MSRKNEKNQKEQSVEYKRLRSTSIVYFLAVLAMIGGVIYIISALNGKRDTQPMEIIIGIGVLLSSAPLFLIANISEDLHWQSFLQEFYGDETRDFQETAVQKLADIENLLRVQEQGRMNHQPEETGDSVRPDLTSEPS